MFETPLDDPVARQEDEWPLLRASALRQARRLVEFYRIRAEELQGGSPAAESAACVTSAAAPPNVKYRHPLTGETWDGLGPHPEWMRQALLRDGYRVVELRVEPAET